MPKPERDPDIEPMCEAWWNVHAVRKWADCPEEWKDHYRDNMEAALRVYIQEHKYDNDPRED